MTGKTFDEKFLENWDSDKQSFKDDFQYLFEAVKAFNEFMKTESLDIEAVENISEVYKEIDKVVREVEKYFINWTNKVIDEAKNKEDEFYYLKICRGLNQLNADIKFGEYEFWNGHNGKEELFSTTVDVLEELDVKFAVLKSQMQDSITKLERCKSWLEIRNPDFTTLTRKDDPLPVPDLTNPDLTAPTPKGTQTPAPDEIEPPQPPKEGKGESVIIPPGTYYFQYNVMKELGLIDEIITRFHDNNGRGVSNSEIGQILFDIFQHKSPEEWSKAHSQYGTESSNDPIKSEIQQRRLRDFLRQNNLKE